MTKKMLAARKSAKKECMNFGINFSESWWQLSNIANDLLVKLARKTGYRKTYNANSCLCNEHQIAESFFMHLKNKVQI